MIKRIGILTGGGDCPGLNAVIRAVVKIAIMEFGIECYGIEDGYKGLVTKKVKKLELDDVAGIIARGGTILGTSNRDNPFKWPVIINGKKEYRDYSNEALKTIEYNELDALIIVGGDGTQSIGYKFHELGVPVIGIPKTIDNDISGTDVSFGFDTALSVATTSLDKLHSTAESHHRVMVMEVMGRYAGWIALHAGVAGGADVILIPEIPFRIEKVAEKISERGKKGKRFSMVVVAEGAKPEGGEMVYKKKVDDPDAPFRLGGIGNKVGEEVEKLTDIETRVTVLGHLQRGGSPTPFDRLLATRFGYHAILSAINGDSGKMVALRCANIITIPIKEAIETLRRVSPESDLVKFAQSIGTSFGV
ncbi:MAG: ATP-dependent 6-phosphofructokinase [Acidobacteriota bacterium]